MPTYSGLITEQILVVDMVRGTPSEVLPEAVFVDGPNGTIVKQGLPAGPPSVFAVPTEQDCGVISADKPYSILLWNAGEDTQTLSSIGYSDVIGYTIVEPSLPYEIAAKTGVTVNYSILARGYPAQSTTITFGFNGTHPDVSFLFYGSRSNTMFIKPSSLAIGAIVGETQHGIYIWNATSDAQNLTAVEFSNLLGYSLENIPLPYSVPADTEVAFTLTVTESGPAVQSTEITFSTLTEDLVCTLTGTRATTVFLKDNVINAGVITIEQKHVVTIWNSDNNPVTITDANYSDSVGYETDLPTLPYEIAADTELKVTVTVLSKGRTVQDTTIRITIGGVEHQITLAGTRATIIYLDPDVIACGLITADQDHPVNVWNASVSTRDLTLIEFSKALGYDYTPPALPYTMAANEVLTVPLTINQIGPLLQDMTVTFTVDGTSYVTTITGTRDNYISVNPTLVSCGLITTPQIRSIVVSNGSSAPASLTAIEYSGTADGYTLVTPSELPCEIPLDDSISLTLTVLSSGGGIQDTTVTLTVDAVEFSFRFYGTRVIIPAVYPFDHSPNRLSAPIVTRTSIDITKRTIFPSSLMDTKLLFHNFSSQTVPSIYARAKGINRGAIGKIEIGTSDE